MKVSCPSCSGLLSASDINVASDVAVCPHCAEVFAVSSIVSAGRQVTNFNVLQPPSGVSFYDSGFEWTITASTRSPIAFFLVPFMFVWSGFSLGGIYGGQIAAGKFSLLLSLFGIPFLLGTLLFGSIAIMAVCGKIVISSMRNQGRIFTGVGPIGWTRTFDWGSINAIEENETFNNSSRRTGYTIALVGQTRLKFGSMLSDEKRFYIVQTLRKLLAKR
jgi:hypothetical protein